MNYNDIVFFLGNQQKSAIYTGSILFLTGNLKLIKTVVEGLNFSEFIAQGVSIVISMTFSMIIAVIFLCRMIINKKYRVLVICLIINAFYISPYIINMEWYTIVQYLCFILPFVCLGILIALDTNGPLLFLQSFLKINKIGVLCAIAYIVYIFFAKDNSVGYLSYGDIAYIFLPFLIINAYYLVQKKQQLIYGFFSYSIYLIALFYTGTRSAIICMFFLFIGIVIYFLTIKKDSVKKIILSPLTMMVIASICIFYFTINITPQASRLNAIKNGIIYEITNESQAENSGEIEIDENPTENSDGTSIDRQQWQKKFIDLIVKENYSSKEAEQIIYNEVRNMDPTFKIEYNRITLWTIALEEFKESPAIGGGLNNYESKVGMATHNVILEAFADFGLIGGTLFTGGIMFLLIYNFIKIKRSHNIEAFGVLLFIFSFIPFYLLYTGLYFNGRLIFSISFLLMWPSLIEKISSSTNK